MNRNDYIAADNRRSAVDNFAISQDILFARIEDMTTDNNIRFFFLNKFANGGASNINAYVNDIYSGTLRWCMRHKRNDNIWLFRGDYVLCLLVRTVDISAGKNFHIVLLLFSN